MTTQLKQDDPKDVPLGAMPTPSCSQQDFFFVECHD